MLPNARMLVAAGLMTAVITFALLSQIASYLPQANHARARTAPPPPVEAYRMPIIVSRAAAQRHEELHRLTLASAATPQEIVLLAEDEVEDDGVREIPAVVSPEAADPVPPREVFAEVVALGARAQIGATVPPLVRAELSGDGGTPVVVSASFSASAAVTDATPDMAGTTAPVEASAPTVEVAMTASIPPRAIPMPRKRIDPHAKQSTAARAAKPPAAKKLKRPKLARVEKPKEPRRKPRVPRQAAPAQPQYGFPFSF